MIPESQNHEAIGLAVWGRLMYIIELDAQVLSVAFSPNGETFLTNTLEGGTFLWETASRKLLQKFRSAANQTLFTLFSPDGMSIFSPSLGYGESTLYEIASSNEHRLWQAVGTYGAAFSYDGASLLIAGDDGKQGIVQMFGAETGALQWTFETHQEWEVNAVIYSLDGTRVIASTWDALFIWDSATGQMQATLTSSSAIHCLACSPTDAMILAGCDDGIRLWDAATGNEHEPLLLPASTHGLAFSPDGAYLLAGGEDAIARLWRWPERALVSTFEGHAGVITSVTFSPDGKTILTGSLDTTVRMWPLVTEHPL